MISEKNITAENVSERVLDGNTRLFTTSENKLLNPVVEKAPCVYPYIVTFRNNKSANILGNKRLRASVLPKLRKYKK